MQVHDIPELDRNGLRRFGLTTGGLVVLIFGVLLPWLFAVDVPRWPFGVGGVLAVWAVVAPSSLKSFYRVWMRFGFLMAAVMNPLVLGLVFVFVMTPVGIVMRLSGKDPLLRRWDPSRGSYRQASRRRDPKSMERPF